MGGKGAGDQAGGQGRRGRPLIRSPPHTQPTNHRTPHGQGQSTRPPVKSVKNIRKITRTMELIATARFKKAMDRSVADMAMSAGII